MAKQLFKGIKSVLGATYAALSVEEKKGYIWFVRTIVDADLETDGVQDDGVLTNDEYDIYFGTKHYGHFQEGQFAAIDSKIADVASDVADVADILSKVAALINVDGDFTTVAGYANLEAAFTAISNRIGDVEAEVEDIQEAIAELLVKDVAEGDAVLTVADGILSSKLGLKYENNRISLLGKDDAEIAGFDASAFIKDGVLDDVKIETRDGEKYIIFTWNVEGEGETPKTDELKVSDFAKLYEAGTALELAEDGVTFNVKVASANNFLSVNDANELIVDDMTVDKTFFKEDITIEGGPLASIAKQAYTGGTVPSGTSIQEFFKNLLCVEIYPSTSKSTPAYGIKITSPSISSSNSVSASAVLEVGATVSFNSVTATAVSITGQTNPTVSGFKHGYSNTIDGDIVNSSSVSGEWTIGQKDDTVYTLTPTITGFVSEDAPETTTATTASDCSLGSFSSTISLGTNTYKVVESAPVYEGTYTGVDSKYIVSNLNGRSEAKKSQSIAAVTTPIEKSADNQSASFSVTGVYPCYSNIKSGAFLDDASVKLSLTTGKQFTFTTTPTEVDSPNNFMFDYPATHTVSSFKIKDLQGNWVDFSSYYNATSKEVTKEIQGNEVKYNRLTTGGGNGPADYQITLNKNLNTK